MKNVKSTDARVLLLLLLACLGLTILGTGRGKKAAAAVIAPQTGAATCNLSCQVPNGGTMTLIEWSGGVTGVTGDAVIIDPHPTFSFHLGYTSSRPPTQITYQGSHFYRFDLGAGGTENLTWCYNYSGVRLTTFTDTFPAPAAMTIDLIVDDFVNRRLIGIEYFAIATGYANRVHYSSPIGTTTLPQTPGAPDQTILDPAKWGNIVYELDWPQNGSTMTGIPTTAKGVFTTSACPTTGDSTPPEIFCPANVSGMLDLQQCAAALDPGAATATDNVTSSPVIAGTRSDGLPLSAPYPKGVTTITWRATDEANLSASCTQTVTINCPTVTLPSLLGSGGVGAFYDQTLSAMPGGNYSYSVTGTLPPGLSLNSTTGRLSGTPTRSGQFHFTVTATACGCSGSRTYDLSIGCPTITINPAGLADGRIGVGYNTTVGATPSGAYSYSVTSGALPPGLSLDSYTGTISGTPAQTGAFIFRITAANGACSGYRDYTLTVGCGVISLPSSLASATAGADYSQSLAASPAGGYSYSIIAGGLPPGLALNSSTGALSGKPNSTGSYGLTIRAQTSGGCGAQQAYTLTVNCPTIMLGPVSLPDATTGAPYSAGLVASPSASYSYAVTAGALPAGLSLNSYTGVLSGAPSQSGSFTFTITVTGWGACSGSRLYTLTVNSSGGGSCPSIGLSGLPDGAMGQLYSQAVAASPGGSYAYAVTAGSLPPGLTLYGAFGLLYGYPTAAGTYTFTITATDGNHCTGSRSYLVRIGAGT